MNGETDLGRMLATLTVARRPEPYCFLTDADHLTEAAAATIEEAEGRTIVVPVEVARQHGFEPGFVAAWLTLEVHSALAAGGLTAAVSRVLADEGIPCNVLAGFHHDHLLVPADRADDAVAALERLRG